MLTRTYRAYMALPFYKRLFVNVVVIVVVWNLLAFLGVIS